MPEKEKSKRGDRTGGGDRKDSRSTSRGMNRATSMRSVRSGDDLRGSERDRGRSRDGTDAARYRSSSSRGLTRNSSARSLRSGKHGDDKRKGSDHKRSSGGSDHKRGSQSERAGKAGSKTPLERQTSNNEDSMAMLLGLAGKKKPRKRSDSDSSSSSSSNTSRSSSRAGPPLTGEKAKKKVTDGPLLRATTASEKQTQRDEGLALDLSNRSMKGDDDTSSFASSRGRSSALAPKKFMDGDDDSTGVMNMSRLAFPTVEPAKKSSHGEKNTFVSRPDLRNVDQSVNLRDVEAGHKRPGMKDFQATSASSFTSATSSSAYSRNSFNRNKKNPYLKVSPWENALYAVKDFCRNITNVLCNKACLAVMAVILVIAIVLPIVLPNKIVKESSLLVPMSGGTSDGTLLHPAVDTIEKGGITYLAPVFSREEAQERMEIMQKILMEHRVGPIQTDDPYAEEGMRWMAEYDPAQIPMEADEGVLLQRYALAVFFFATHPGTMANRTREEAFGHLTDEEQKKSTNSKVGWDTEEVEVHGEQDERRIDSYGANWMIDENICTWQGIDCLDNTRVVALNMSGTTLQGTLPAELGLLKELTKMDISQNYLEGTLPEGFLERLTKLNYLVLHDNLLSGHLPERLGEWTSLSYVNLAQNKFDGNLPDTLDELTNLQLLFLQENLFSGSIPSLKGMKALEYLYLNNNDFSGTLPRDMFKDKALVDVRLEYNALKGPLPDEVHKLHALEVLSVGNNDFSGTIPDVFHHTKALIALDLHKNSFSGSLPASLGQLTALEHLLLDNNEITGTLASDWFQMPSLRTLVLHHNKLEGIIPSTIRGLSNLQDLWLNSNSFSGTIPNQLAHCSQLVNLYLHENLLSGTIPKLKGLEHLGSLRVYHNSVTGEVSKDLCGLKKHYSLSYIAADCDAEKSETGEAEVTCSCCDKCY